MGDVRIPPQTVLETYRCSRRGLPRLTWNEVLQLALCTTQTGATALRRIGAATLLAMTIPRIPALNTTPARHHLVDETNAQVGLSTIRETSAKFQMADGHSTTHRHS